MARWPAAEAARPRILQVGKFYPPYRGGMETHLQALCAELARSVDLEVVVSNGGRETVREVVDGIDILRLGTLGTFASAPLNPGLRAAIAGSPADIVHVHLPHPTAIISYLLSGHDGILVATYHSDIVRQRLLGAAFSVILHRFLRRCSAIICTSPQYIESSVILRRHRNRCHVLPFSIPLQQFEDPDPAAVSAVRARYGDRIVLGVGRLVGYKGFEHLITAMAQVRGMLLLIGSGPLRSALEARARTAGVMDRVVFLGAVADVAPYYHAADVFALPSIARSEAFGLVQLEAMACGVPVVNTRLPTGVVHVSPDGLTGLTVPPGDAGALAGALNRLLDDPPLRARLGAAGRRRAREHFNLETMGRRTLELYADVLATRVSRAGASAEPASRG